MKKLKLSKKTISRLTDMQMSSLKAGDTVSTYGCTTYAGCGPAYSTTCPGGGPVGGGDPGSGYGCNWPGGFSSLRDENGDCITS